MTESLGLGGVILIYDSIMINNQFVYQNQFSLKTVCTDTILIIFGNTSVLALML